MSQPYALPTELVVQAAAELQGELLTRLACAQGELEVDGSAIELIDGAGLQLLLAAQKEARRRGLTLRLRRPSAVLQRTLGLTGLRGRFPLLDEGTAS
ncbi:STAS domain-containing protein [Pseudomarimonas arenosa]|uniref:STAS domain-containing protein n=1 Tax=Pseudomarimonas arenosa TaxID=2774145 RepID=A0AAW3ZNT6_9GAMM|nr:STAS domain-containing protein [Pseudomarimonas arenosa]MBD8527194.1 STAS domain-containing protein [Pseudomarimonas arenosa]